MLYSCFRARVIDEVRLIYFIANKVLKKQQPTNVILN